MGNPRCLLNPGMKIMCFIMSVKARINLKELPTLLPHNIDWAQYFHNDHPVDLEIGCGRTHFFFDRALNFPDRNIVGVEWKYEFIEQAHRRITRDHVGNAAAFHGNAWLLVPLLFKARSISHIFINFPDPWWKLRHKKRLVVNEIFLTALRERMVDAGFILLQTDVEELFWSYHHLITNHGAFALDETLNDEDIVAETRATTHREKKCLEAGMRIFRGKFRLRDCL